jgi:soluble lytic murein transglycosylase-like protein
MNALKATAIIIISILFIAFIFSWGYQFGIVIERSEAKIRLSATPFPVEDNLVGFVYAKSEKISIDTARLIVKEALKTERPLLILAMISAESEFVPSATSPKGAIGLMQIIWHFHGKMLVDAKLAKEKRDLYNVGVAIQSGNFLMNGFLKQENGDLEKALHRYLGGKDGNYVKRILLNLGNLYLLVGGK